MRNIMGSDHFWEKLSKGWDTSVGSGKMIGICHSQQAPSKSQQCSRPFLSLLQKLHPRLKSKKLLHLFQVPSRELIYMSMLEI